MRTNPKGWRKDIKKIRLNRKEMQQAGEDSLEFVFRDKMGPTMNAASEFLGKVRPFGVPVGKALFPFFKTSVKLLRFAWNRSPFKFMEEGLRVFVKRNNKGDLVPTFIGHNEKTGKLKLQSLRGFDAQEGGKALAGTAVMTGLAAYVWGNNGRFVGAAGLNS
jgi:hypothetical protein